MLIHHILPLSMYVSFNFFADARARIDTRSTREQYNQRFHILTNKNAVEKENENDGGHVKGKKKKEASQWGREEPLGCRVGLEYGEEKREAIASTRSILSLCFSKSGS
jgi:hypothetical protein